jgi:hypothetical protein
MKNIMKESSCSRGNMLNIGGVFNKLSIDPGRFTKTLDKTMEVQLRQAARAWLRAVVLKVPVWTGTARGTLRPLGQFLRVSIPISPVKRKRGFGPDIGAQRSAFSFNKTATTYSFEFDQQLAYYAVNDFYHVNLPLINPTPWGSFRAGEAAFNKYVQTVLPERLPRVEDLIVKTEIKIARN